MTSDSDLAAAVDGLVHEGTQVHDGRVDLTVAEVYVVELPGRVDFGGDELEPAATTAHETSERNPDDDYEWWSLDGGRYLVEYNETLTGTAVLQARAELLERGASHPTRVVDGLPRMPLAVSDGGLRLKENARVSTLVPR
ncbi:dCTP deaminase [Haloplanus sp. GCM10025708]|uniref:dCTP deaminase n=1 Tax=Haloferacaceae TaxID=1644056 RepID=UPI00360F09CA